MINLRVPDPEPNATVLESKRLGVGKLLSFSFAAVFGPYLVITLWGSSLLFDDLLDGVGYSMMGAAAFWAIAMLPINLITLAIFRWRGWLRHRSVSMLAPSLLWMSAFFFKILTYQEPSASEYFKIDTGCELPATATDLRAQFFHPIFGGNADKFYFRCNPQDVKRLIAALKLTAAMSMEPLEYDLKPGPGWPDAKSWPGLQAFRTNNQSALHFYTLITDAGFDQVYFFQE